MNGVVMKNKGFTLFEVLVSMGIFIVILLIAIVSILSGDKKSALKSKALEITSNLRTVQINADTAFSIGTTTPRGWGIHFVEGADNYIIFAKTGGTDWLYSTGDVIDYKTVNLGSDYNITSDGLNEPKDPDNGCNFVQNGILDIVFSVPVGQIYFNGLQPNATDCGGGFNPAVVEIEDKVRNIKIGTEINWVSGRISNTDIY